MSLGRRQAEQKSMWLIYNHVLDENGRPAPVAPVVINAPAAVMGPFRKIARVAGFAG